MMPHEEMDVGEEMFDDKVHKPINNKKRCGIFLGLLSLSLLLIVPIVSVTLYQFVTCFEMNHKLSLGNEYRNDNKTRHFRHQLCDFKCNTLLSKLLKATLSLP